MNFLDVCIMIYLQINSSGQHAIFQEPPSRASIGILKPMCNLPKNHDHMSVYCGGFGPQHNAINMGRCAICGDEFSTPNKEHQAGGRFATGTIARSYRPGQLIDVEIDLVANHFGFFTFAICPHNNILTSPSRDCFLKNQLMVNGVIEYFATAGIGLKKMKVQLPEKMTCKQCIFQFTYTNGNNWGAGPQSAEVQTLDCLENVGGKLGCGPQETFRGCADICIGDFCPFQDQCAKVSDIKDEALVTSTTTTTIKPTTTSSTTNTKLTTTTLSTTTNKISSTSTTVQITTTAATTTSSPMEKICVYSGIKSQYWSQPGDFYCRSICQDKPESVCWEGANTHFLCYCQETPPDLKYLPVIINITERN